MMKLIFFRRSRPTLLMIMAGRKTRCLPATRFWKITLGVPALCGLLALPLAGCSLFESDSDFMSSNSAQSLTQDNLAKAHELRLQKKYKAAIKILSQLVLASPDNGPVLGEYGKTLVEQGRSGEALEFLKRAVELQPHDATLYSALGVAWDQAGNASEAQKAYQQALQLSPNDPSILNNYALSRLVAGHAGEAEALIRKAEKAGSNARIQHNAQLIADVLQTTERHKNNAVRQKTSDTKKPSPKITRAYVRKNAKPIISDARDQEVASLRPRPRPKITETPEPQLRPENDGTPQPELRPEDEGSPQPQLRPE